MKNIVLVILLSFLTLSSFAQIKAASALYKYRSFISQINTVAYNIQRIDTFANGEVWNSTGSVIIQRNSNSKILRASFLSSQIDAKESYYYDGQSGFYLNDKENTFRVEETPYAPSVLGSPPGQMLVEEVLAVDTSFQMVTYARSTRGIMLDLKYPDNPSIDLLDHHVLIQLDSATGIPKMVKTISYRGGGRWTTTKILSNTRTNFPEDADILHNQSFFKIYKPIAIPRTIPRPSILLGQLAPKFTLTSFNGSLVDLNDYRGKVILLDFWETSCSPCIAAIPDIQHLKEQYEHQNFKILSILIESGATERAKGILKRKHASYLALAGNKTIKNSYKIISFPRYIVISKNGRVAYDQSGGNIQKAATAVQEELKK